jgi:hypothetical protein
VLDSGGDTWKRSTASSGSIRTPGRDNVYGSIDVEGEEKDRSGGSGSSGRRKPLPMEFRGESLVRSKRFFVNSRSS